MGGNKSQFGHLCRRDSGANGQLIHGPQILCLLATILALFLDCCPTAGIHKRYNPSENWLRSRCLASAIVINFSVPLRNFVGNKPWSHYSSNINHLQGVTHPKTGWAQDAWPKRTYGNWYFHLDIPQGASKPFVLHFPSNVNIPLDMSQILDIRGINPGHWQRWKKVWEIFGRLFFYLSILWPIFFQNVYQKLYLM